MKEGDEREGALGLAGEEHPSSVQVALWGLVLFAGCRAMQILLEAQSMAGSVGQAVLVEWGSARLGVAWNPPSAPGAPLTGGQIARRAGFGAAVGFGAAAVLCGVLVASRSASFENDGDVHLSILGIGFISAAVAAWRDELLLHGITLRALDGRPRVGSLARVLACGATSTGLALGRSDASAQSVVVAALLGVVFGSLWLRDRGAWQPWAAHTALRFATGTLFAGGLFQTRLAASAWSGGNAGMLGGTAAVVTLAPLAVFAALQSARTRSPQSAKRG
jgi:hypothetical protein